MGRYFLDISYEGTNYAGWQIQNEDVTVQGEINNALSTVLNIPIETSGGSRTDAGVHARHSFAHFDLENDVFPDNFDQRINNVLPKDIAINAIRKVADDAHARFDASSRTYEYAICYVKDPFKRASSYYYYHSKLDLAAMNKAAQRLLLHEDYAAFSKANTQVKTTICKIKRSEWIAVEDGMSYWVEADRFLRGMVRALVGTMILVGRGKMSIDDFEQVIISKDRERADFSAPAKGLFLDHVTYPFLE